MAKLPGKDTSLWLATTDETDYPKLSKTNSVFDTAVIGGGISGILTGWLLQKAGLKTVVIEKNRIVENTTGNTTAKLTSQHNLIYDWLIKKHGRSVAKTFGRLNQQAIEDIEAVVRALKIDCDFERADAFVYTNQPKVVDQIKAEVKAAKSLGLPASYQSDTELPFKVKAAIGFANQAQFHPRKFLLAVAADYIKRGGRIFEQTEAQDIATGRPAVVKTQRGDLNATNVIVASKYPMWRQEIFTKHAWTKLSYALGVQLKDNNYPRQMYITSREETIRTIRSHPYKNSRLLIFGGESHHMTPNYNKTTHYQKLAEDVKRKFNVDKIIYRWIAGDMMPYDRLPIIGNYPGEPNIYVITGFQAWGLTWGMIAAQMISDLIAGNKNSSVGAFRPERFKS